MRPPREVRQALRRLGLPEDANVAGIRSRYAERLRERRPEDDPQAFAVLRADYTLCLAHARLRASEPPTPVDQSPPGPIARPTMPIDAGEMQVATPSGPIAPAPVADGGLLPGLARPVRTATELAALLLAQPDVPALQRLRASAPELEVLHDRRPLETALLEQIAADIDTAVPVLDAISDWFGWDDISGAMRRGEATPDVLARFHIAMQALDRRRFRHYLDHGPYLTAGTGLLHHERAFLRRLSRPRATWRIYLDVAKTSELRQLEWDLVHGWITRRGQAWLATVLDRRHLLTWMQAASQAGNRHALAVGLLRVTAMGLAAGLLLLLFSLLRHGLRAEAATPALWTFAWVAGIGALAIVGWNLAVLWFRRWRLVVARGIRASAARWPLLDAFTWPVLLLAPVLYLALFRALDAQLPGLFVAGVALGLHLGWSGLGMLLAGLVLFAPGATLMFGAADGHHALFGAAATLQATVLAEFLLHKVVPRWRPRLEPRTPHRVLLAAALALPAVVLFWWLAAS